MQESTQDDTTKVTAPDENAAAETEAPAPAADEAPEATAAGTFEVTGLIFDLDGTLVDTREDIANSVNAVLESMDRPTKPVEEIAQHIGHGLPNLLSKTLETDDEEVLEQGIDVFREHYAEHCLDTSKPYPGAAEILDHFKDKACAVVSNKPEYFCRKILAGLGLDSNLMAIVGGDTIGVIKPDPEPVTEALELMGVDAEAVVLVGDDVQDIEGGRSAGTRTCAVTYGLGAVEALRAASPDYVVDKLSNLAQLFA